MGLTIHFRLRCNARGAKAVRAQLVRLRERALDLPFARVDDIIELAGPACDYQGYAREHPNRWLLIQAGQYVDDPRRQGASYGVAPTQVIAFSTWPGEGCEEANFGLCRYPATIEVDDPHCEPTAGLQPQRLQGGADQIAAQRRYASDEAAFEKLRQYVWALLDPSSAIPPSEDAVRIESSDAARAETTTPKPSRTRSAPTVSQNNSHESPPVADARQGDSAAGKNRANGHARSAGRKAAHQETEALIDQAEKLRDALRDALAKTSELVKALKQHRRRSRSVDRTLESLRQLRTLGV